MAEYSGPTWAAGDKLTAVQANDIARAIENHASRVATLENDVVNFVTEDDLPEMPDISDKADRSEIPDVSGFATQSAVDALIARIEALETPAEG